MTFYKFNNNDKLSFISYQFVNGTGEQDIDCESPCESTIEFSYENCKATYDIIGEDSDEYFLEVFK